MSQAQAPYGREGRGGNSPFLYRCDGRDIQASLRHLGSKPDPLSGEFQVYDKGLFTLKLIGVRL